MFEEKEKNHLVILEEEGMNLRKQFIKRQFIF